MPVELGLHVFPCRSDKTPACPRGFYDAVPHDRSADLFRRYPGPLTGMRCGAVNEIDVLDLDVEGGLAWLVEYECTYGPLPATRIVATKSGGLHYYWQHRNGMGISAGLLGEGVDIRGEGGYAIMWDRAGCRVLSDAPIAEWPGPMLELLREATEARRGRYAALKSLGVWSGAGACGGRVPWPLHCEILELMEGAPDLNQRRVRGILRPVVEARENRNRTLYEAALQFRELIGAGIIVRDSVEQLLFMCMEINGYVAAKVNGAGRARGTIRSGLNATRYG
jgi:hypothetical protein